MVQRRFSIAVRHLLARAASSTPPRLPLGDETPGNTTTSGQPALRINLGATSSKENKDNAQPTRVQSKTSGKPAPRTKTSGQPAPRSKRKHRQRRTYKSAVKKLGATRSKDRNLGATSSNFETKTSTTMKTKRQETGIEHATSSAMKLRRNQLNHPTFQQINKNKIYAHSAPRTETTPNLQGCGQTGSVFDR